MRFIFTHSHVFPGASVTLDDDGKHGPGCLVEFGDGSTVIAEWHMADGDAILQLPAYRTAKGTTVAGRDWRLVRRPDGTWRSERIG
ncbi:hypothetical protein [Ancylobacter moscoviensis]